jgi:hypothetical protein
MKHLIVVLFLPGLLLAQWPEDPATNFIVCDHSGEQTQAKVQPTSDGGCWISWQDNSSGNYDTWAQRLDADGQAVFEGGLLVSDHPQDSWITDYDMVVDHTDCAVIAINDIRRGSDRDITAYRISPEGEFLWGADGLAISDNDGFEPDPRICITAENNMIFGWQEDNVLHLRKVSTIGEDMWDAVTITLAAEYALSIPRVASDGGEGVLLQYLEAQGSQFWSPKYLKLRHFDESGATVFAEALTIQDAGGFGPQMRPDLIADGSGGAWSFWYDSRDNTLHAFAQRVLNDGTMAWTPNGIRLSTVANQIEMEPQAALAVADFGFDELVLAFRVTNSDQNQAGIRAQRLLSDGSLVWGAEGLELVALSAQDVNSAMIQTFAEGCFVSWLDYPSDFVNSRVMTAGLAPNGDELWPRVAAASTLSPKSKLISTVSNQGSLIACWRDDLNDSSGDIHLQNVNSDGSFGAPDTGVEPSPVLPAALELLSLHPNPFNPATKLVWRQEQAAALDLQICDLAGRQVFRKSGFWQSAGRHQLEIDGSGWASGIYLVTLAQGSTQLSARMLLLR